MKSNAKDAHDIGYTEITSEITCTSDVPDSGLSALCGIAAYYRIPSDAVSLSRELALSKTSKPEDIVRAAKLLGLKGRIVAQPGTERLSQVPTPAVLKLREGGFVVYGGRTPSGDYRIVDPVTRTDRQLSLDKMVDQIEPFIVLVQRRLVGAGTDPRSFGFQWFLPSIWRYRRPLMHVLIASLFVQLFALVSPLIFQIVVDKVLAHSERPVSCFC